jgi:hypothetical protein
LDLVDGQRSLDAETDQVRVQVLFPHSSLIICIECSHCSGGVL